jgi:hypothetical protein
VNPQFAESRRQPLADDKAPLSGQEPGLDLELAGCGLIKWWLSSFLLESCQAIMTGVYLPLQNRDELEADTRRGGKSEREGEAGWVRTRPLDIRTDSTWPSRPPCSASLSTSNGRNGSLRMQCMLSVSCQLVQGHLTRPIRTLTACNQVQWKEQPVNVWLQHAQHLETAWSLRQPQRQIGFVQCDKRCNVSDANTSPHNLKANSPAEAREERAIQGLAATQVRI